MKIILLIASLVISLLAAAIPVPGTDVWFSQFIAVALFGFLFIAIKISEVSLAIGLFYAYCSLSMVFVAHFNTLSLLMLTMTGLSALVAIEVSKVSDKHRGNVIKTLFFLLIFQIAWGVVQKLNMDPFFRLLTDHRFCDTVGFSGSHNQYSFFISALSPLFFDNILLVGLVLLGLFLSTSFAGFVGFCAAYLFYHRKRIHCIVFGLIIMAIFIFVFNGTLHKNLGCKFEERFRLWKLSVAQVNEGKAVMKLNESVKKIVTCNPFLGFGFGEFFQVSPYTQEKIIMANGSHRYEHAHNDYVEIFFDLGRIGFGLFIFSLFSFVRRLRMVIWDKELNLLVSMLIAVAFCALSIYTVHTSYNGFLIAILIGLTFGKINSLPRKI